MKFVFTILFLFFLLPCFADIYYISPAGNDITGTGTANNPWRTLHKAASSVTKAGDIIHVKPGIYSEAQQINLTPGVSIEGEGITSVIKSSLTEDWKEILSLRSEEGTDGNQHISNLKFDGQNLSTFWAICVSGRSNVSIHNCTITDFKDRGVIFDGRNDNVAGQPGIYATGNRFYDNIVSNCAAYNTANGIYGRGCLNIGGQDGMLIYNNTFTQNQRPHGYNGYLIKYSNDGYLKNIKIYNNTLVKIPFAGDYGGDNGWDFAIEFWNIQGGMEIYGNTIQGAIDLVNTSKGPGNYAVWIHDNTISQQVLNKHFESGVIFEVSTEAVIVEKNIFKKISGGILFYAQENTFLSDIIIRDNRFEEIGKNSGNGNNGSGININCGTLLGNENRYSLSNLTIYNNSIIAAENNAPFYGIEITGAGSATNINIRKNTISNFIAACIVANPANVIDTMLIEENTLSGNGNNNDPFYILGTPGNYVFKKNIKSGALSGSNTRFNFRQQLLRPLYHEVKNITPLEYIALFSFIIFLWFAAGENIYAFPAGLVYTSMYIFISFDKTLAGLAGINLCFTAMFILGWIMWSKRDRKNHRIIRLSSSTKKDWVMQLSFFTFFFAAGLFALTSFKQYFSPGMIPVNDAFTYAASFTGIWSITRKKTESWYWLIAASALAIPTFFLKHYLFFSGYQFVLLVLAVWGAYKWKRRILIKTRLREIKIK